MPVIDVLSPHVADLIAAGEVVDRPASAVKELLENAVDAGAHSVTLELTAGGRGMIRVRDDGCGMAAEDAGVCFLRHATSKLRTERDLEAIGTLGFRGEALAAISAVSRITMTTRSRERSTGVRVEVEAGDIRDMVETGCPAGTTITVRDLFYNTPARQKFLGSDRSEAAACVSAAMKCALGHPEVSFRCIRDRQEEFFTPGDGRAESAVYALLGREFSGTLLPFASEQDGIGVSGYVSAPGYCRGNRTAQYFFCNGRPIRSKTLQTALEQAYKNSAMVGKFPACVIYITLPNGLVDVNVHPTKAEVKFAREKAVFDAVYYGVLSALGTGAIPELPLADTVKKAAAKLLPAQAVSSAESIKNESLFDRPVTLRDSAERPAPVRRAIDIEAEDDPAVTDARPAVIKHSIRELFRPTEAQAAAAPEAPVSVPVKTQTVPVEEPVVPDNAPTAPVEKTIVPVNAPGAPAEATSVPVEAPTAPVKAPTAPVDALTAPVEAPSAPVEVLSMPVEAPTMPVEVPTMPTESAALSDLSPTMTADAPETLFPAGEDDFRVIGEALRTYILVEQGERLLLIDKHAAHERILFDRMRLDEAPLMSQELLISECVTTDADGEALVAQNMGLFEHLGFSLESFGRGSFIIRAVPADIDPAGAAPLLEELIEKLREGRRLSAADVRARVAETVACKAAIKAGWVTEPEELLILVRRVLSGEIKTCPHGRPVVTAFSRTELDRLFGRLG